MGRKKCFKNTNKTIVIKHHVTNLPIHDRYKKKLTLIVKYSLKTQFYFNCVINGQEHLKNCMKQISWECKCENQ